ncbi:ATP-binding protein [Sphingobacterium sp. UT-1RO-CII-1]|uniref:HD domain-containing protein n=1 Tax=Sphingobacterium sp. UT-1RO-CII-1 TaxID=2995225 RepID=UPI00227A1347|nr:ATP-binding protein [Sphingobacterium sp. UT-1RO-CII-1]MCY4779271.1 ATP-binding protein [Sphingobacterium sp. UT-1RO-CII-1]
MSFKIDNSLKLDELELVSYLKGKGSPFIPVLYDVYANIIDSLDNRIAAVFPKYTLHNSAHSFRIIEYMAKIVTDYKELSDLEITMLICSALLHDIGMAASDEDITAIKSDSFVFSDVKYSNMQPLLNNDEIETLQEFIRRIHAKLSARYIRENLKDILKIPKLTDLDFAEELALVCESHTESHDWINRKLQRHVVRGEYVLNGQFIASVLRIADILDVDQQRTPYKLYKLINPKGRSNEEWLQHFVISNTDKIEKNPITNLKQVVFHGTAKNADTHRKLLNYIDWVEIEIAESISLLTGQDSRYNLLFDPKPKIHIKPEGYTFSGYKMTLEFAAISSLLMGEKIYGDKKLGLRELIQNSLDACRLRKVSDVRGFGDEEYVPSIKILLDREKNEVIIKDNGIGMSMDVLKNHFLNIGVSYYKSFEFLIRNLEYKPIGNYGIGFLSCFMLSDTVRVKSRYYRDRNRLDVQLEKGNEWTSLTEMEDSLFFGTEVILNYNQFMHLFNKDVNEINGFLSTYFLTDGIEFQVFDEPNVYKIENPIDYVKKIEKGNVRIDLSDYLEGVEGYAVLKNKTQFIKDIDELDLQGEIYVYQKTYEEEYEEYNYEINELSDCGLVNFGDFVKDNELQYLLVPLVEDENVEAYTNGMNFTDDIEEVIEKLDNKLRWISILIPSSEFGNIRGGVLDNEIDELLDGISYNKLVKLGHNGECPTKSTLCKIKLFEGRKNELYLPFDNDDLSRYFWKEGPRKELFVRSVLIKDFEISLPWVASVFELSSIVVNVNSRKFIPDISRNKMDSNSSVMINNAIGKALHKAAIDHLGYGPDEQKAIQDFVSKFYPDKTEFEKC